MSFDSDLPGQLLLLAAGGFLTLSGGLITSWLSDRRRFRQDEQRQKEQVAREVERIHSERQYSEFLHQRSKEESERARERERQEEALRVARGHLELAYKLLCSLCDEANREQVENYFTHVEAKELHEVMGLVPQVVVRRSIGAVIILLWSNSGEGFDREVASQNFALLDSARDVVASALRGEQPEKTDLDFIDQRYSELLDRDAKK